MTLKRYGTVRTISDKVQVYAEANLPSGVTSVGPYGVRIDMNGANTRVVDISEAEAVGMHLIQAAAEARMLREQADDTPEIDLAPLVEMQDKINAAVAKLAELTRKPTLRVTY